MMLADSSEANEEYAYIVVRKADTGAVDALDVYIAENRATYG